MPLGHPEGTFGMKRIDNYLDLPDTLEDVADSFGFSFNDCSGFCKKGDLLYELETWTERTDHDVVLTVQIDGKDRDNPAAWKREVDEEVRLFDPEWESVLWYGTAGAPTLTEMLSDFSDFKANRLVPFARAFAEKLRLRSSL